MIFSLGSFPVRGEIAYSPLVAEELSCWGKFPLSFFAFTCCPSFRDPHTLVMKLFLLLGSSAFQTIYERYIVQIRTPSMAASH